MRRLHIILNVGFFLVPLHTVTSRWRIQAENCCNDITRVCDYYVYTNKKLKRSVLYIFRANILYYILQI